MADGIILFQALDETSVVCRVNSQNFFILINERLCKREMPDLDTFSKPSPGRFARTNRPFCGRIDGLPLCASMRLPT